MMKRKNPWSIRLFLSLGTVAASVLVTTLMDRTGVAQECSNFWVNPETGVQECLDDLASPTSPSATSPSPDVDTSQTADETNWMLEHVTQRVIAQTLEASPDLSAADIEAAMTSRIVGGTLAGAADNRFQVGLLNKSNPNAQSAKFCGGTLYKNRYVITAAHCSDFVRADQVQVVTYSSPIPGIRRLNPLPPRAVRRNVARIDIHPGWSPNTTGFDYDVAVWRLTAPVPGGVSVTSLATATPTVGTATLATGWGSTFAGGAQQNNLRKVTLPLVSPRNCNDANSYNGAITARMLCAGRDRGGIDTCQGDSGGPLALGRTLIGITSFGQGCALPNKHGVYTRISHNTSVAGRPGIRSFIVSRTP